MEKPIRGYYAIIPANVRYDKELPANAKLLYGEITALCNERGYCWASNSYFASLYSSTIRTIQLWIKALEKKGYIRIKLERANGTNNTKRYISIADFHPPMNFFSPPHEENFTTPHEENFTHNNTVNNITSNITDNMSGNPDSLSQTVTRIITYLNAKTGRKYTDKSADTKKHIRARLQEGFQPEDFKVVIDKACIKWLNRKDMNVFIRPKTLFSTKFEGYLNERVAGYRESNNAIPSPREELTEEEKERRKQAELERLAELGRAQMEEDRRKREEQERKRQERINSPEFKAISDKIEAAKRKLIGGM